MVWHILHCWGHHTNEMNNNWSLPNCWNCFLFIFCFFPWWRWWLHKRRQEITNCTAMFYLLAYFLRQSHKMTKQLQCLCFWLLLAHSYSQWPPTDGQTYPGPPDKSKETFASWWSSFQSWRDEISASLDLSIYDTPEVDWARTSFLQPQLMIHDR